MYNPMMGGTQPQPQPATTTQPIQQNYSPLLGQQRSMLPQTGGQQQAGSPYQMSTPMGGQYMAGQQPGMPSAQGMSAANPGMGSSPYMMGGNRVQQNMSNMGQQMAAQQQPQQGVYQMPGMQNGQPNLENQVLSSGNPQEISNFMSALNNIGAGSNNTFMNNSQYNPQQQAPVPNMINGMANGGNQGPNSTYLSGGGQPNSMGANGTVPMMSNAGAGPNYHMYVPTQNQPQNGAGYVPISGGVGTDSGKSWSNGGNTGWSLMGAPTPGGPAPVPGMAGNNSATVNGNGSAGNGYGSVPNLGASGNDPWGKLAGGHGSFTLPTLPPPPTMSDQTAKTKIDGGEYQVQSFLDAIKAHSYEYKDAKHGVGRFISPMAQELEKTEVGKSAIIETPEGKMVDYGRLGGISLAALADLHQRVKRIEDKKNKAAFGE